MNFEFPSDIIPPDVRLSQIWPAAEGWRVARKFSKDRKPTWEINPIIAWALVETSHGQNLTSISVTPEAIELEDTVTFLGYLRPGEIEDDAVLMAKAIELDEHWKKRLGGTRLTQGADDEELAAEELTAEEIDRWEADFVVSLHALNLPQRIEARLVRHLRSVSHRVNPRPEFVAKWIKPDIGLCTPARLYSFDEWCQRVATIGSECIPRCYLTLQQRADLIAHARAYLESLSPSSE